MEKKVGNTNPVFESGVATLLLLVGWIALEFDLLVWAKVSMFTRWVNFVWVAMAAISIVLYVFYTFPETVYGWNPGATPASAGENFLSRKVFAYAMDMMGTFFVISLCTTEIWRPETKYKNFQLGALGVMLAGLSMWGFTILHGRHKHAVPVKVQMRQADDVEGAPPTMETE